MKLILSICDWSNASCLAVTRTSDLAPEYQTAVESVGIPQAFVITTVLVIAAAAGGYWFIRSFRVPVLTLVDDLTLELCRAHGIGLQHRMVLDHVANLAGIKHTAEMFLSSEFYDAAIQTSNTKKRLKSGQLDSLHIARRLIFGDIELAW